MKHAKKLVSMLLALVMVLGMTTTAFAAHVMEGPDNHGGTPNTNGVITINDAIPRETYNLYQILYLESYSVTRDQDGNVTEAHYAYKANSSWSIFINSADIKGKYVDVDDSGYVTWVQNASAADFAKKALEYAQNNGIDPVKTAEASPAIAPATTSTVEFTGLKLGYYLVDTSLGALCSLDTTNPTVTMQEKNEVPKNYKQVKEDSGPSAWMGTETAQGENDADLGQQVEFRSIITVYPGTDNLIFHDQMCEGLTFTQADVNNIAIQFTNTSGSLDKTLVVNSDYTVEFNADGKVQHVSTDITGNCTFHIKFSDSLFEELQNTSTYTLTITYTATLNRNAVIGVEGNLNTSMISYGDKYHATPGSITKTRTYGFTGVKIDAVTKAGLSDTEFELHANNAGMPGDVIELIDTGTTDATGAEIYRVATAEDRADSVDTSISKENRPVILESFVTNDKGRFVINGLDASTYYLVETEAKDGYNKLKDPVAVTISYDSATNAVVIKQGEQGTVSEVTIENGSGSLLPSTGGMGTTIFYIVGAVLLIGAVVLLITRKRMNAERN